MKKNRIVNFRVSEAEYVGLRNLCRTLRGRSVSDLARRAVYRLMAENGSEIADPAVEVRQLRGRVDELEGEVRRLVSLVKPGPEPRS